jgi:hypothetical protein
MVSSRIGLAILGAFCIVAAGAGGFLATRHAAAPVTATAPAPQSEGTSPAARPVDETEAVMDDQPQADPKNEQPAQPGAPAASGTTSSASQPQATGSKAGVTSGANQTAAAAPRASSSKSIPAGHSKAASGSRTERTGSSSQPTVAGRRPAGAAAADRQSPPAQRPADTSPSASSPESHADGSRPQAPESAVEPSRRIEPVEQPRWQERQAEELVVSADSVMGLQLKNTVSSETSRVEDRVEAQVARDVSVNGRVAIPAGSRVLGAVTLVERGGKVRDRARVGVRFHTLVLADGTTLRLQTDTVYREGESPANASAAKMGGAAIGGAILGAILGGGKGAVIGGATGAAGGTAAVMAGPRRPATIDAGSTVTVRVLAPVSVTVER